MRFITDTLSAIFRFILNRFNSIKPKDAMRAKVVDKLTWPGPLVSAANHIVYFPSLLFVDPDVQ